MDKMVLGSYTFEWNPVNSTIPKKEKSYSIVKTYSGAAYFSWGTLQEGQEILIEWGWMKEAQWDQLQTLLEADTQIVWDPQTGTTYNVEVTRLEGIYFESSLIDAAYRKDIKLLLVIISEV